MDSRIGDRVVLRGRLDASTVTDVRTLLNEAIDAGEGELAVDLAEVSLLDATGLGMLVAAHRRAARTGRTLVLHAVPERIQRVLRLTRLDRVLVVSVTERQVGVAED